ncbi:hypothetical protein V565_201920, partial [Rhizoctonia solani 123E]
MSSSQSSTISHWDSTTVPPLSPSSPTTSHSASTSPEAPELPIAAYGSYAVRDAVREIKNSPFWIGNSARIASNFEWITRATDPSAYLKWKDDAPDRPDDAESDDDVYITWIGVVTASGSVLGADGNYNEKWKASGVSKHKRVVWVEQPPPKRDALKSLWECQLAGAKNLVESACRTKTGHVMPYNYSFFVKEEGALRARSPLFIKSNFRNSDNTE